MTPAAQLQLFAAPEPAHRPEPPSPPAVTVGASTRKLRVVSPADERDAILDRHETNRAELVAAALVIARRLAERPEGVTASEMRAVLEREHPALCRGVDMRCLGACLLPSKGFARTAETRNTGHHARPRPVWRRR